MNTWPILVALLIVAIGWYLLEKAMAKKVNVNPPPTYPKPQLPEATQVVRESKRIADANRALEELRKSFMKTSNLLRAGGGRSGPTKVVLGEEFWEAATEISRIQNILTRPVAKGPRNAG